METGRADVGNGHPGTYGPCDAVAVFACMKNTLGWQSSISPGVRVHLVGWETRRRDGSPAEGTLSLLRRAYFTISLCTLYARVSKLVFGR